MKIFKRLFPDKERRAFNKMHRRHRKELVKLAKKTMEKSILISEKIFNGGGIKSEHRL